MIDYEVHHHEAHLRRSAQPRAPRLTRRGQLCLIVILAVLMFAAFSIGRVTSGAAGPARPPRSVVVGGGETLWSLATHLAPNTDPRVTVSRLEALNHLDGALVEQGQTLLVPPSP